MNPLIVIYAIIGIIWLKLEHNLFKEELPSLTEMPTKDKVFCLTHQSIHYLRVVLLWPSYMFEELLLYLYALLSDENEE